MQKLAAPLVRYFHAIHYKNRLPLIFLITSLLSFLCCNIFADNITKPPAYLPTTSVDPYEKFNRNSFKFNHTIDYFIFKPISQVYKFIIPGFIRNGVTNFFSNVNTVPAIVNDTLQGNFYWAMNDSWHFIINTTVGIGGIFNIANTIGLQKHRNTFGLTLSTWGAKPSPYITLPLLGPFTAVDAFGIPVDYFFHPSVYYYPSLAWNFYLVESVNTRANFLNQDAIIESALDPYILIRQAYLQRRAYLLWINAHPPIETNTDEAINNSDD